MTRHGTPPADDAVAREYAALARRYDRRWSSYVEATARETVRRLEARPGDRVLDVGCGTGALLVGIAQAVPGAALAGIDLSSAMLAVARAKLGAAAALCHGRAERLPFADAAFDVVVSASVLHYIRRPEAALAEMHRVLRPGGRIVITDWCHDFFACRACDRALRLFNRAHFRTLGTDELARLVQAAGFADVAVVRYKVSWLWGLMTGGGRKPDGAGR